MNYNMNYLLNYNMKFSQQTNFLKPNFFYPTIPKVAYDNCNSFYIVYKN